MQENLTEIIVPSLSDLQIQEQATIMLCNKMHMILDCMAGTMLINDWKINLLQAQFNKKGTTHELR